MKAILSALVVLILFASIIVVSGQGPIDLSTLRSKPVMEPVKLPRLSPALPTYPPTALGGNLDKTVIDLSTLSKKLMIPAVPATLISGPTPITVTPSFAIRNTNITGTSNTIFTLPQAISANATVYTPAFAIFGGA
jgi:hypothetical protein